jgi:hypothetical protein
VYRCYFGVYFSGSGNNMVGIQSDGIVTPSNASTNINVIEQCEFAKMGNPHYIVKFTIGVKVVFRDCIFEQLAPTVAVVVVDALTQPVFDGCWFENAQGASVIYVSGSTPYTLINAVVNNCLFHTYAVGSMKGLIEFGAGAIYPQLQFTNNHMSSLQTPIISGGNNAAFFSPAYNNYATVGVGGDATGLNATDPAKFDRGINTVQVAASSVKFPATQVPSANANTLDDYEEGTWTPVDTSGAGLTFTGADGKYTKIGNVVTFSMSLTYPTTANTAGAIISKPPFANIIQAPTSFVTNAGLALQGLIAGTGIEIYPTGSFTNTTNATLSGKVVYIGGTYLTAT